MLAKAEKCRKLAAHLKRAETSRKLLHKECGVTGHNPNAISLANDTRWDSDVNCMKGVVYHKPCLLKLAQHGHLRLEDSEGRIVDLIPSFNDFLIIEAGVEMLQSCKTTTKLFEMEKIPTMPLVVERLYAMDQELEEFMVNPSNKRDKKKAVAFGKVLREKLRFRFPEFGTDRLVNCFGNFLNPSIKGVHLKLVGKFDSTKDELEEKLEEWKAAQGETLEDEDVMMEEEDEEPKKLSATEALKKRIRDAEARREEAQQGGRGRGGRMTMGSEVMHFSFCFTIMVGIDIIRKHHNFLSNPGLLFLFSASGFQVQEGVQQLRGSPRCCGKC